MLQMPVEISYPTACRMLGEAVVREQLLVNTIAQQTARIASLEEQVKVATESGFVIEEAEEIVEGVNVPDNGQR